MRILFLLLFFILLQSSNSKNCIDCDNSMKKEYVGVEYMPTVLYECPKNVKVYLQKYTCNGCGYFEVSVRDSMNKTTRRNCAP